MINYDHSESSRRFYDLYNFFPSNCILFDVPVSALYDKSPSNVCVQMGIIFTVWRSCNFFIGLYYEVLHLMVWKYLQPNCRWGCLMEANLCAYCKRQTRFPLHGCVAADGSSLCCNYYVLPLLTVLYAVFHALLVLRNSPFGVVKKNCARPSFQRLRLYFSCVLLGCTIRLFSNCCTFT